MSIRSVTLVCGLPAEMWSRVFSFLQLKDLGRIARVWSQWKDLTNLCETKKTAFKDLIERRITSRINSPSSKECYFIVSMLKELDATPRLVSKFIRGGAANQPCVLSAISLGKALTAEQLTDALDENATRPIIEAVLSKLPNVPESSVVAAIRQGNTEILPLFLEKSSFSPQWLLDKAIGFEKYCCIELLFSIYSDMPVSITDVVRITESTHLAATYFELILNQYLKQKDNKIAFDTVQRVASIVDERLALHYAPHSTETEKIFELLAKAYVKINEIRTFELLTKEFEAEVFIRNGKHPVMAAKLIQAVEDFKAT
jgi:hypothetical protein